MVIIPYEFIEALFGKTVADNFDTIVMICMMIGVAIVLLGLKRKTKPRRYEKEEPVEKAAPRVFESTTGKWSPTGWCFNDNTGKWEPPEYLSEESRKKWRWDAQKQVWIDVEKETQDGTLPQEPRGQTTDLRRMEIRQAGRGRTKEGITKRPEYEPLGVFAAIH